jgi:hypothetical protein
LHDYFSSLSSLSSSAIGIWLVGGNIGITMIIVEHLKELSFILLPFKATTHYEELGEVGNSIEELIIELWCR